MDSLFEKYCAGCGLCHAKELCSFQENKKGFLFPAKVDKEMMVFCNDCCPMGKNGIRIHSSKSIWGDYKEVWAGCSSNSLIRRKGSSGGVLTGIAVALLERGIVDGIIQVKAAEDNPTSTQVVVNSIVEAVIESAGSRYSKSSPLYNLFDIIDTGKKYAFIGKPCDVTALRNYLKRDEKLNESIIYLFSFFCAGTPSQDVNDELLKKLGTNRNECMKLTYRGDGWPGQTKAIDNNGREYSVDYQTAWMETLGRDIRYCCKFCFDSIGENADISCGDYWYLTDDGLPDFTGKDGRNCIFAWTEKGQKLLNALINRGVINVTAANMDELGKVQPNHFNRRSTLFTKLFIMKLMGKEIPAFSMAELKKFRRYNSFPNQCRAAKGTIERIIKGKV